MSKSEFEQFYEVHICTFGDIEKDRPYLDKLFQFLSGSTSYITKEDIQKIIKKQGPVDTLIERLRAKVRKGGERLLRALHDEFMEADIPYGCEGSLPLANFQTILNDYDIPMLYKDFEDLKSKKFAVEDKDKNVFVLYKKILNDVKPKKQTEHPGEIMNYIIKVQKVFRGHMVRKTLKLRKSYGA